MKLMGLFQMQLQVPGAKGFLRARGQRGRRGSASAAKGKRRLGAKRRNTIGRLEAASGRMGLVKEGVQRLQARTAWGKTAPEGDRGAAGETLSSKNTSRRRARRLIRLRQRACRLAVAGGGDAVGRLILQWVPQLLCEWAEGVSLL